MTETLANVLTKTNNVKIVNNCEVTEIKELNKMFDIYYKSKSIFSSIFTLDNPKIQLKEKNCNFVISALPANVLGNILSKSFLKTDKKDSLIEILSSVEYADMSTLNFSYDEVIKVPNKCSGHVLTPSK